MKPYGTKLLIPIALLLLFIIMVISVRQLFTLNAVGANDFYPRYRGAMLFWRSGIDPYSPEATEEIQRGIHGRLAQPHEDQALFVYPFYTTFLLLPLTWLPLTYSWIQAIWLTMLLFTLAGSVYLISQLLHWELSPFLLGILLLWAILSYHSVRVIILGQFAGVVFLFVIGTLLALQHEQDKWAGFLLAWATIKPQMVVFLIPALLLWAIGRKRWLFIGSFILTLAGLFLVSFLLLPNWLVSFVEQVLTYPTYTAFASSPLKWLTTSVLGQRLLQLFLLGWMVWEWHRLPSITAVSPNLFVVLGVTLITSALIFDQTATTNQVLLYLPLLLACHALTTWHSHGRYIVAFLLLTLVAAFWVLFLFSIQGNQEHPLMYWPLPLLVTVCLTIGRPFIQRYILASSDGANGR